MSPKPGSAASRRRARCLLRCCVKRAAVRGFLPGKDLIVGNSALGKACPAAFGSALWFYTLPFSFLILVMLFYEDK